MPGSSLTPSTPNLGSQYTRAVSSALSRAKKNAAIHRTAELAGVRGESLRDAARGGRRGASVWIRGRGSTFPRHVPWTGDHHPPAHHCAGTEFGDEQQHYRAAARPCLRATTG